MEKLNNYNNNQSGVDMLKYDVRAYYTTEGTTATPNWVTVWGEASIKINQTESREASSFIDEKPIVYSARNYPNPCNPSTTFEVKIPASGYVQLKIFDQVGREVATLIDRELTQGVYNIRFDGKGLSSGIYFYRMAADKFNQPGKILLLK